MEETFKSRLSFVMASVGSAVGLGNIFRFPALAVKYGGVFIPAYLLLLCLLGLPLLTCELAAGRFCRSSAVGCIKRIAPRFSFVGWAASASSFIIMCYYCLLFSFVLLAAFFSYRLADPTVPADGVFFNYISPDTGFPGDTLLFLIAAWAAVILCYGKADRIGKISTVSVFFSVGVILIIALIQTVTRPDTLLLLLRPEPSHLAEPSFWADVTGQVFFSLSVGVGVMFTYGSYLPRGESIPFCGGIIALLDLLVSLAATVIYASIVGQGESAALLTCFSVYPKAFRSIFGAGGWAVSLLFYLSLALLCLDSVFSYLKSAASAVGDPKRENARALILALVAAVIGSVMLTERGQGLLNFTDELAARYLTPAVGLFEFIIFGYIAPPDMLRGQLFGGRLYKVFIFLLRSFCPAALIFLILSS